MENKNVNEMAKNIGHKMGTIFATVLELCVMAMIIALTVKFIFWLF